MIESPLYSKVDNKHITLTTLTTSLRKQKLVGSTKNKTFFPGPFYDSRNPEKDKIRIKDDPDKKKQTRIKLAGNKSQETSFQRSPIA